MSKTTLSKTAPKKYVVIDKGTGHIYADLYTKVGDSRSARVMAKANDPSVVMTIAKDKFRLEKVKV